MNLPVLEDAVAPPPVVELAKYDWIVINSSAGKDSQCMLDVLAEQAKAERVEDRVVVVHADLGDRVEWPGTRELAAEQAAHYGFRFEIVRRKQGDILDEVRQRHRSPGARSPSLANRPPQDQPGLAAHDPVSEGDRRTGGRTTQEAEEGEKA
jgi:3'-phosphoadenosine 5'-phosphosulfate sulfotransferase (PAPS reductase)/FAD synthetase